MQKLTFQPSAYTGASTGASTGAYTGAYTDQQKPPRFSARGSDLFANGEIFSRRGFMDFIKRLVRGLLPKFKQPSRSQTA